MTDDLRVVAVVAIVVVAFAAVGLVATEGMRYDGLVAIDPEQPIHLERDDGASMTVGLSQLTPGLAAQSREATIADDEGWGVLRLGSAPLSRKGFAFKFEAGTADVGLEKYFTSGFASNIQFGYFPLQYLGFLATASLGFGTDDLNRDFFRNFLGLETQLFLPSLSVLHLGGYANLGNQLVTADGGFLQNRPAVGAGALLEIELTTRLALLGRAGYTFTHANAGGWEDSGISFTAGIAVY